MNNNLTPEQRERLLKMTTSTFIALQDELWKIQEENFKWQKNESKEGRKVDLDKFGPPAQVKIDAIRSAYNQYAEVQAHIVGILKSDEYPLTFHQVIGSVEAGLSIANNELLKYREQHK